MPKDREASTAHGKIKVLYIAGASRSGSTILEKVINSIEGAVSLGEVSYLWERGFKNNWMCGCGQPFNDCPFWDSVRAGAYGEGLGGEAAGRVAGMSWATERFRHLPLYFMGSMAPAFQNKVREYSDHIAKIYEGAGKAASARFLVDSSKHMHGFVLKNMRQIDLHVLHLVRDSRATTFSWTRRKVYQQSGDGVIDLPRFNPWFSSLHWIFDNLSAELLKLYNVKYMRIRYEDFAEDPQRPVDGILRFIGETGLENPVDRNMLGKPAVHHSVSGNPVRFSNGPMEIKTDEQWKTGLPAFYRLLVTAVTMPLLVRYGYIGFPAPSGPGRGGADRWMGVEWDGKGEIR